MITKICKECGKPFEAENGHSKYCNRDHYRPCPGCGTPILIKYLSMPTPFCSRRCHKAFEENCGAIVTKNIFNNIIEHNNDEVELENDAVEPGIEELQDNFKATSKSTSKSLQIDDYVTAKYIGKSSCGFITGHKYVVKLVPRTGEDSRCSVKCIEDVTSGNDTELVIHFSNSASANMFFDVM